MSDLSPFLKSLLSVPGLSGHESAVARLIEPRWRTSADELHFSRLGSIHALKRGDAPAPRPSLLITAHMDAVGLMVAGITPEGFLHLSNVGGLDLRVLPGQAVTVHGRETLPGVITLLPPRLLAPDVRDPHASLDYFLVDVGLPARRVEKLVRAGDLVAFATEPMQLSEGILSGHTLDNRASVAALTACLEAMQADRHAWDVWLAATVQEEISYAGAATSAFALRPHAAVIVDVTFAYGHEKKSWQTFPLGGGPTLGIGPEIHPFLLKRLKDVAKRVEIPFAIEPMAENSGTEAAAIQLTAAGIPTAVVSIPIRYMHTPVEVAALKDIERTGRLLAEFAAGLEADFLDKLEWDA